jgi:AcrR family transcriptional regulator
MEEPVTDLEPDIASNAGGRRRGPQGPRGDVAVRILAAARRRFAADGFDGTAITAVASDAGVDAKVVRYYFRNKVELFEASLQLPPEFAAAAAAALAAPAAQRGQAIVSNLIRSWTDPELGLVLRSILLMAAHEKIAMAWVRVYFEDTLLAAVEGSLPDPERQLRAGLISTQLIGLAFSRYIFALRQTVAADDDVLIRTVGATIQRYLDGPIG